MKFAPIVAALATVAATMPALADMAMAQKYACTACHAVDKKVVGPAYADVAKKYAGQKDAVAKLTESITKGGSGKWGPVPMPAQTAVPAADVAALAAWIAGGAK